MGSNGTPRRQRHGSAWYWKQTGCWYYTAPGTKNRVPLLDEDGKRVRGKDNRKAAELALARVKLAGQWRPTAAPAGKDEWLVARVCSEYLQCCQSRVAAGTMSGEYGAASVRNLNALCEYCGGLPVSQLKKGHVQTWIDSRSTWRSPVTHRNVITTILAAFNYAQQMHDVPNPLKGLKKPPPQPRLHSLSHEDEQALAFDHYGKQWSQHYQEPLWAAVGLPADHAAISSPGKRDSKAKATAGPKAASSIKTSSSRRRTRKG